VIAASQITRRFGERLAVDNLTFTVPAGEVFGLLGPNGAGKTTTLRMLGGLIVTTAGTVAIDGRPFTRAAGGDPGDRPADPDAGRPDRRRLLHHDGRPLLLSLAMVGAWVVLILLSVALFERETILTRWT
jgi:ABC-type cobalamin/Fe3+-siderophores transport system ATPase subunit